jgi:hypothetical protein
MSHPKKRKRRAVMLALALCLLGSGTVARSATADLELAEAVCIADPQDASNTRLLLLFNVPAPLLGATIDLAELDMSVLVDADAADPVEMPVEAFAVCRGWSAQDAAWDEGWDRGIDSWNGGVGSYCDVLPEDRSTLVLDVTEIVQIWCRGEEENLGLVVVPYLPEFGALTGVCGQPSISVRYTCARTHGPGAEGH